VDLEIIEIKGFVTTGSAPRPAKGGNTGKASPKASGKNAKGKVKNPPLRKNPKKTKK
jgi:hypothetical protein